MFAIAGLAIAFVWVSIWLRFRDTAAEPPPPRPDVRAWSYLGCLELELGEWQTPPPGASVPSVPEYVMLFPDTFDEWGREYSTFRAIDLDDEATPGRGGPYRWFTRADTLWLVWSDAAVRGGIALREFGRSLSGRAGLVSRGGSVRLDAPVTAWTVNCYSRERDWLGRRRR